MKNSTDFFSRQANALRATRCLVLWFTLALAGTSAAIYCIIRYALSLLGYGNFTEKHFPEWNVPADSLFWDPVLILAVTAVIIVVVGGSSLLKTIEFSSSSGADIAQQLGGSEVSPATAKPDERRLINVVQEMSLASGVPVPRIFILERESGINAFAAGTQTSRAAVAVSRGALDKLSRDELQAVIGHEFSHILNGDMKLNIRLAGWIFGLVMVSMIGQTLFRIAAISSHSRSRNEKNSVVPVFIFVGIALIIVGFISQIFSQIIQAAISRHRERLADASATQFTRNPIALANALSRIGGDLAGSRLDSPRAEEFAHLFFADGINAIFSTHPPLEERIRALNPNWDGKFLPPLNQPEFVGTETEIAERLNARCTRPRNTGGFPLPLPVFIEQLSQTTPDAKALVYLLMMTDSPEHNVEQAKILLARESSALFKRMETLWPRMKDFPKEKRISGILLAAPALREMSARERRLFCETLDLLARADNEISLYEFCILNAAKGLLIFSGNQNLPAHNVIPEAELVLNLVLRESGCAPSEAPRILENALGAHAAFPRNLRVLDNSALTAPALEAAFEKLRNTQILVRRNLLDAAKSIVLADGKTSAPERDLLDSFAVALNCPKI